MKQVCIFTFILLLPLISSAQDRKAVANKLKSVTVSEQKYEKGVAEKILVESVTRYDQSGNVVEEIRYKQGRIGSHLIYKYDGANNKIQESELDPAGKTIKVTVYTYSNNLRTERTVYDGNKQILSRKIYRYETY